MPKDIFYQLPEVAQERIVLAAAEIIIEQGFFKTTMEDIALRLKVGIETLERYFDNVRDIIAAVLGSAIQHFSEAYILVGKLEKPFWDKVEVLFDFAAQKGLQYRPLLHVYLNISASGLTELAQATYERFEGRAALFFQNLILSGVQEGALRDDVDVSAMALHFQVMTRQMMSRRAHPLYTARSKAYFPDLAFDNDGDRRLQKRILISLKTIYGI